MIRQFEARVAAEKERIKKVKEDRILHEKMDQKRKLDSVSAGDLSKINRPSNTSTAPANDSGGLGVLFIVALMGLGFLMYTEPNKSKDATKNLLTTKPPSGRSTKDSG